MFFLDAVLQGHGNHEEDFFVNMIKLVLLALSSKSLPQDVADKATSSLQVFLHQISQKICQSDEFSPFNKQLMQSEIQVHTFVCIVCICV